MQEVSCNFFFPFLLKPVLELEGTVIFIYTKSSLKQSTTGFALIIKLFQNLEGDKLDYFWEAFFLFPILIFSLFSA